MRNIYTYIFSVLFLLSLTSLSCKKDKKGGEEEQNEDIELDLSYLNIGNHATTAYIKGSLIDFNEKVGWNDTKWLSHFQEMKDIGIETLVVQFGAYNQDIWMYTSNNYSSNIYPDVLGKLFTAADAKGIGVYMGLYFDDEFWSHTLDQTVLTKHANRSKDLSDEIWGNYKNHTSFKGWYISHEFAPYYYQTEGDVNTLIDKLINPVAKHCKEISGKPVGFSVFFNASLSDTNTFQTFMNSISKSDVELIILQDGIGVGHCGLNQMEDYYSVANQGLVQSNFFDKGALWADIETFAQPAGNSIPAPISRIIQQLDKVKNHVSFTIHYQYYQDMCFDGPNTTNAVSLRSDYLDYLP